MASTEINESILDRTRTKRPESYDVVFLNDDFTPMDFVVMILERVFFKRGEEAEMLMLRVHNEGRAVVGTYSYDIAHSKTQKALELARSYDYPLRIIVE